MVDADAAATGGLAAEVWLPLSEGGLQLPGCIHPINWAYSCTAMMTPHICCLLVTIIIGIVIYGMKKV